MGSDESHFNVSVGSDGQSQDSVHKPQPFRRERRAEAVSNRGPSAYQPNALPLGQTGSQRDAGGTVGKEIRWRIHQTYVALHHVTWCMVVWCTQELAPAMPAL